MRFERDEQPGITLLVNTIAHGVFILVALVLGVMLFLAGFLGEMVARSAQGRNNYQIRERI